MQPGPNGCWEAAIKYLGQIFLLSFLSRWLGLAVPLRLTWVKLAEFYPPDSCFLFCFFSLDGLKYCYYQCLKAWKPLQSKKSKNATLLLFLFFHFNFIFAKTPIDCLKMSFATPNKGDTCFKHYIFLYFDKNQLKVR